MSANGTAGWVGGVPGMAGTGGGRGPADGRPAAVVAAAGAVGLVVALFQRWWTAAGQAVGAFDAGLHPVVAAAVGLGVLAALDTVLAAFVAPCGPGRAAGRLALAAASLVVVLALSFQDWIGATRGAGMIVALVSAPVVVAACALQLRRTTGGAPAPGPVVSAATMSAGPASYAAPAAAPIVAGNAISGAAPVAVQAAAPAAAAVAATPAPPQPFWFFVDVPTPMMDTADTSRTAAVLQPGAWYVAHEQRDGWLAAEDGAGRRGWVPVSGTRTR